MKNGLFLCLSLIITAFTEPLIAQSSPQSSATGPSFPATGTNAKIISKIIPSADNTWGYDILVNDRLLIHQLTKPSLPGNKGFATKTQAQKVADLVIEKIRKGEMPPSVSQEEMKKLQAL